jgi:hypothetical protein
MLNFALRLLELNSRTFPVAEPKQEETFKVIDRRLFTQEGELRKDVVEQERREEESVAKKSAANARTSAKGGVLLESEMQGQLGQSKRAGPLETPGTAAGEAEPSRNFQMLVDFLTRNAAALLGGMADPRTGQAFVDLEGAREVIDMLDALREKTRGNLAKVDEDLLIEVLGSLKLTFMEVSKAATEVMAKKAKGKP